ncbi:Predicted Zn-dependent peptidase [Parasphingorhabdus marina DSM 22363]|uniref:Predicted Zn-dependent peptidase n=1 Tax=Parasphingorhabdus marina DSM 22363 TaxID=1123272 RepID=A0A1N6HBZ6_9SPHN|nr:pitrilysin family protein [Parasphingorhabdus marina]SIO17283.1 Predicted Zn-dependent peptidase [Parasphingorhabdus marina DSM 22363]
MSRFSGFSVSRSLGAALAATALTVSAPAFADKHASPKPAPVSELVDAVNIPYEEFTLDNGLKVLVHTDRKAPIVAVSIWYGVGSKHEPKGKTGYAHLFEHIMFNGSENAPGDFFEPLRQIGATDLNGTTWLDRTNYFQTVPKSALEVALFLESDRMGYLLGAVTQEKLDNQIGVVSNEKRQGDNRPYGLVSYRQTELLFPDPHPYGHSTIGSLEDLEAASLEDMKTWFTDHYGPNNAILVLAGDIDAAAAQPLVEKWFGAIPRGKPIPQLSPELPTLDAPVYDVMKDKVATTRIYRNWIVPGLNDPDYTPLDVGMTVLGGLASSRLDNIMVRQEKNAVAVSAYVIPFVHGSLVNIQADVKPGEDADAVAKRLDEIIADFIQTGPTVDEVQRVATRDAAARIAGLEQVGGFSGKAVALAEGELYSDDPGHYKKELSRLASATPEAVTKAMQKWLTRPVVGIRVVPGEREAYDEVASGEGGRTGTLTAPAFFMQGDQPDALSAPDRSRLPDVGEVPNVDFPDVEETTLSNGIKLYFAKRDAVPMTRVSISFNAGSTADPKTKVGLQNFVSAMMEEGTTSLNSVQIAEQQERLGASISVGGGRDRTRVSLSAVNPNLDASLDLLADIVKNPAFNSDEIERIRVQQLTAIDREESNPRSIATNSLPPLIFGENHPYGRGLSGNGTKESVASITREDLVNFHSSWMHAGNAEIFAVGDIDRAALVEKLEARFGTWQAPSAAPTKNFDAPIPDQQGRIVVIHRANSPQSVILAGQVTPANGTDDLLKLNAANEILGGNFLSRINMDLRETKGWSYGTRNTVLRGEGRVPYIMRAPVQTNQTGPAVAAMMEQVKGFLGENGVTPAELERTVNGNVRQLPGQFERSTRVLGQIQNDVLFQRPLNYAETVADRYKALTADDLNQAMADAIDPDKFTWVIVGDADKIKSQLEALNMPIEYRGYEASDTDVSKADSSDDSAVAGD